MADESEKWKVIGIVWVGTIFLSVIAFCIFRLFTFIVSGH